jgi:hypothetical protein
MPEHLENPDRDATPQLLGEDCPIAGQLTGMSIRVWAIDPGRVMWSGGEAVIALIADLVTAGGGHLAPESEGMLRARFDCQERAVCAARRVQRSLRTFSESPDIEGFAASIAIYKPDDEIQSGAPLGNPCSPLAISAPYQILVSDTIFEALHLTPGLQFRLCVNPSNPEGGYQELLWTDAESLAVWQERVVTASRVAEQRGDHRRRSEIEAVSSQTVESVDRRTSKAEKEEHVAQILENSFLRKNMFRFTAGASSLVLLAVVGLFVFLRSSKTHETRQQSPKTPTVEQQVPDKPAALEDRSAKQSKEKLQETGSTPVNPRITPNGRKASRESASAVTDYDGFTNKQIPQLLRKAEEDAGAGNFDDAKREYDIVLKLQPGNTTAVAGLRKLAMKIAER